MTETKEEINNSQEAMKEVLIRRLGIYELRDVARRVGISSPTTKKSSELIELILEKMKKLQSGDIGNFQVQKKGRPFKKVSAIDDILNAVSLDMNSLPPQIQKPAPSYDQLIVFAQEVPTFTPISTDIQFFTGVIRETNATYFFVDNENGTKVFVPEEVVSQYNLSAGDFVQGKCSKINDKDQYVLGEISKINLIPIETYAVKKYDLGRPIISREKLPFGNGEICCGRRNACKFVDDVFEDSRFDELAKECKDRNIKLVVLGLNISYENEVLYKSLDNVTTFTTTYGSHCAIGLDKVVDAIAFCEKLVKRGNKVLLFINDIIEILRTLDKYYGNAEQTDGHAIESVVVTQKLLSLGRAYDSGLWTTILAVYRESDKNDLFLIHELFKVSAIVES